MKYKIGDRFVVRWYLGIKLTTLMIVATTSHNKYVVADLKRKYLDEMVVDDTYLDTLEKVSE